MRVIAAGTAAVLAGFGILGMVGTLQAAPGSMPESDSAHLCGAGDACGLRGVPSHPEQRVQPSAFLPEPRRIRMRAIPSAGTEWRLHALVYAGDLENVRQEVKAGADVNAVQPDRWSFQRHCLGTPTYTPLQVAVRAGHAEVADLLLRHGADMQASGSHFPNLLLDVVMPNQPDVIPVLVRHGMDLRSPDGPAPRAVAYGMDSIRRVEVIEALLQAGMNPDLSLPNGDTPLQFAYRLERPEFFELFLKHGADVNAPGRADRGLLAQAAEQGDLEAMCRFRELGAQLEPQQGLAPLYAASGGGRLDAVRYLLEEGAAVDHPAPEGTALSAAAAAGHVAVLSVLLEHGAEPLARDEAGMTAILRAEADGAPPAALGMLLEGLPGNVDLSQADTPLHLGIRHGLKELVQAKAAEHPELLRETRTSHSLLFYALEREEFEIASALHALGAPVDLRTPDGDHLVFSVLSRELAIVRWLFEHGVDATMKDAHGDTLLTRSLRKMSYRPERTALLLEFGVPVDTPGEHGLTPIQIAVQSGRLELVAHLLHIGAEPNVQGAAGETLLMRAARRGDVPILRLLLAHGADIDAQNSFGSTALANAVSSGNVEAAEFLLAKGAAVDTANRDRRSPLMQAAAQGDVPMLRLLLAHGADINAQHSYVDTALAMAASSGNVGAVEFLLAKGAAVDTVNQAGQTPLIQAAGLGIASPDTVHLLLDQGIPVEARAPDGATALLKAASHGSLEVMQTLVARGAGLRDQDDLGRNALLHAAAGGQLETMRWLVAQGLDPNATDYRGTSTLMFASRSGNLESVRWLLSLGADLTVQDAQGNTALHYALLGLARRLAALERQGQEMGGFVHPHQREMVITPARKVIALLLEHGADPSIPAQNGRLLSEMAERLGEDAAPIRAMLRAAQ